MFGELGFEPKFTGFFHDFSCGIKMQVRIYLRLCCLLGLALVFLAACANKSYGQALYSYVDENGVQVFTNIPPVNPVWDLKIYRSVATKPAADDPKDQFELFDDLIERYAREHELDPWLIRSIIAVESGFNPRAVSPKGAQGLMQLMPATAARLGVSDTFDPEQNIRGGIKHFKSLMDTFNNNLHLCLAAYNAGENLVLRLGQVADIKETRDYVKAVLARYAQSKELSAQLQDKPKYPSTFRFVDDEGVLHLTNIPPLR